MAKRASGGGKRNDKKPGRSAGQGSGRTPGKKAGSGSSEGGSGFKSSGPRSPGRPGRPSGAGSSSNRTGPGAEGSGSKPRTSGPGRDDNRSGSFGSKPPRSGGPGRDDNRSGDFNAKPRTSGPGRDDNRSGNFRSKPYSPRPGQDDNRSGDFNTRPRSTGPSRDENRSPDSRTRPDSARGGNQGARPARFKPKQDGPRSNDSGNQRPDSARGPRTERTEERGTRSEGAKSRPFDALNKGIGSRPVRDDNRTGRPPRRDGDDRDRRDDRGTQRSAAPWGAGRKESSAGRGGAPQRRGGPGGSRYPKRNANRSEGGPAKSGMRLNRFIAHAGISSRREADELIKAGLVSVNGIVVTEMGHQVQNTDEVRFNGSLIRSEKKMYVLLNKPKGFITTVDDPKARKTVMELVQGACRERIYPVGRLDRATTGVLLFTNDGELADKLLHPSRGARKIYEAVLDKPLSKGDLARLTEGIELEDGPAAADAASFIEGKDRRHVGLEIHIGRNRVVRRMFEALGYEVTKLDRSSFAGLTKKKLNRGQWRHLEPQEIQFLKTR